MTNKTNKWFNKNITYSLKNKNILVTGASSGIGLEFSKIALSKGANIIMAIRNLDKGNKIKDELLKINPSYNIKIYKLDISDFNSIEEFVQSIQNDHLDIDVFYNNAGIFRIKNKLTKQGYDLVFGTNYIGTYYLTNIIINYLQSLNHKVDLVLTSSVTGLVFRVRKDKLMDDKCSMMKMYGRSKNALLHYYFYLLDNLSNSNIKVSLVHPGACYTYIIENGYKYKWFKKLAKIFMNVFLNSLEVGSLSCFMALSNESGFYGPSRFIKLKGYPRKMKIINRCIRNYKNTINLTNELLNGK